MYGKGQAINSLYPMLKEAISSGKQVFNMSGGEQLRDYLPVEDLERLIVSLAVAKQDLGAINICSGAPISVRGQVEKWMNDNNWKIKLNIGYYTYPDYEPMAFWCERTKLDEFLHQA
jgi:dTDP-6-deoxy-L-talose 4-dehydrogenase (NAD+)